MTKLDVNAVLLRDGPEAARKFLDNAKPRSNGCGPTALSLSEWLTRDIPNPDFLLGELLSTTSRVLIAGPTGLGKTMFGLAVAIAIASNKNFLHWCTKRAGRVLYIDGEMSRRQMKRRLQDAVRRAGVEPDGLTILSKEDHEDMPPLNSPAGQKWLNNFITKNGPFDLIIFDNIQALLDGSMKDEEQWASVLPWVRGLTRREIGQLWFHHTGHDESRSYGSKAREWQMDVVGLMERISDTADDIAFTLKFTKARERTRENRADFEPITMSLRGDQWLHGEVKEKVSKRPPSDAQILAHEALVSLAATEKHGKPLPASFELAASLRGVKVETFRAEIFTRGIVNKDGKNPWTRISEITNSLKKRKLAAERDGLIWPILA